MLLCTTLRQRQLKGVFRQFGTIGTKFQSSGSSTSTRHFCHDLELGGGDLISSPVDSIASLVSPKKSYGPNSVGKNYFSATPFFTFSKNATGGYNA